MGRGHRFCFLIYPAVLAFVPVFFPVGARAYTSTVTPAGIPVRWTERPIHFNLAGNASNQSGVSESDFFSSVLHGLRRWERASNGALGFDYWQGADRTIYVPNSAFDGLSMIYFASQSKSDPHLSNNVLGLTQVWYDTATGQILETDIALNDRDFRFTMNPRDTSGFGSGNSTYIDGKSNVFIENVITHELGHAMGLSHSGGLQATMLFMESPEQAHLGCDEIVAIRALYPTPAETSNGALEGSVVSEAGTPILGAHVVAISRRRGNVLATALTDKSGHFKIAALEPGTYFLMAEPFYAGPQTLPNYYWGMKFDFCESNRSFGRTVLTDPTGLRPQPLIVKAGETTSVPAIVPRCRLEGGAAISSNPASMSMSSAPTLFSSSSFSGARGEVPAENSASTGPDSGFGAVDHLNLYGANYYRLQAISGNLEVHVVSYSIYSPIRANLSLLDSKGDSVGAQIFNKIYQGSSGYVNFDSVLIATQLPEGDYYLKLSGAALDVTLYPAGPIALDSIPFFLVMGTLNEPPPSDSIPDNARCLMNEEFPPYASPPGNPPRRPGYESRGTGFCATVSEAGRLPRQGQDRPAPPGPDAAAIASWFFPFFAMAGFARILRRKRQAP